MPSSRLGARERKLRQGIGREEPDIGRVVPGLQGASHHDRLEGEEERHPAPRLTGVGVDHGSDDDLETGLLQRFAPRCLTGVLAGIYESRGQRPLAGGRRYPTPDQEQPPGLVVYDDPHADLRVAKVQPTALLTTLWPAGSRDRRQRAPARGTEPRRAVFMTVLVRHRPHRTR
jgi:hypothetical protein